MVSNMYDATGGRKTGLILSAKLFPLPSLSLSLYAPAVDVRNRVLSKVAAADLADLKDSRVRVRA